MFLGVYYVYSYGVNESQELQHNPFYKSSGLPFVDKDIDLSKYVLIIYIMSLLYFLVDTFFFFLSRFFFFCINFYLSQVDYSIFITTRYFSLFFYAEIQTVVDMFLI